MADDKNTLLRKRMKSAREGLSFLCECIENDNGNDIRWVAIEKAKEALDEGFRTYVYGACESCSCTILVGDLCMKTLDGCDLCQKCSPSWERLLDYWKQNPPTSDDENEDCSQVARDYTKHILKGGLPTDKAYLEPAP